MGGMRRDFLTSASTAAAKSVAAPRPAAGPEVVKVVDPIVPARPRPVAEYGVVVDGPVAPNVAPVRLRLTIPRAMWSAVWGGLRGQNKKGFVTSHKLREMMTIVTTEYIRAAAKARGCILETIIPLFDHKFFNSNVWDMTVGARTIEVEIIDDDEAAAFNVLMDGVGGRLGLDFQIGEVIYGAVLERTRGEVREQCVEMTVDLRYAPRERSKNEIAELFHSNGMGGIEVSPVSPVGLLSGTPFVSVELPIEALYLPDAAYRKFGKGFEAMPKPFWDTSVETRYMRLQRCGLDREWESSWVPVVFTLIRSRTVAQLPAPESRPPWLAKAIEVEVLAAAVAAEGAPAEAAPAAVAPSATTPAASTPAATTSAAAVPVGAASAAVAVSRGLDAAIVNKFGKAVATRMATDRTAVARLAAAPVGASPSDGTLAVYQGEAASLEKPLIGSRRGAEGSPAREGCIWTGRGERGGATGGRKVSRILQEPVLDGDDEEPYSPMKGLDSQSQSSLGGQMGEMGLSYDSDGL